MNSKVIYKKEFPGQWSTFTMRDLVDIPEIELTDEIDIRRYPSSQGGGEYIEAKTILTVTRKVEGYKELPKVDLSYSITGKDTGWKFYEGTKDYEALLNSEGWVNQKGIPVSCEKLKTRKGIKFMTKRDEDVFIYFTSGYWMTLKL